MLILYRLFARQHPPSTYHIRCAATYVPRRPRLPTVPRIILMLVREFGPHRSVLRGGFPGEQLLFQRPFQGRKPTMIYDRNGGRFTYRHGGRANHRSRLLAVGDSARARMHRRLHFHIRSRRIFKIYKFCGPIPRILSPSIRGNISKDDIIQLFFQKKRKQNLGNILQTAITEPNSVEIHGHVVV